MRDQCRAVAAITTVLMIHREIRGEEAHALFAANAPFSNLITARFLTVLPVATTPQRVEKGPVPVRGYRSFG